jgi:hypothetical protein
MPESSEPLILIDGNTDAEESRLAPTRSAVPASSTRWRRYREVAIALAVIGAAVTGLELWREPTITGTSPAPIATSGTAAGSAVPAPFPTLVAPATARPGQRLTLVAFERRGLCPETALLLDGAPMLIEKAELIDSALLGWDGTVLTLDLSATLAPGPHRLDLLGATPIVGRGADACGSEPRHRATLATATLLIQQGPTTGAGQ